MFRWDCVTYEIILEDECDEQKSEVVSWRGWESWGLFSGVGCVMRGWRSSFLEGLPGRLSPLGVHRWGPVHLCVRVVGWGAADSVKYISRLSPKQSGESRK